MLIAALTINKVSLDLLSRSVTSIRKASDDPPTIVQVDDKAGKPIAYVITPAQMRILVKAITQK